MIWLLRRFQRPMIWKKSCWAKGREKVLGVEHPSTLSSVNNLAEVFRDQGKYEEAEEMHRRALEGREKVLGAEHPFRGVFL
jgi:hypothetical protein